MVSSCKFDVVDIEFAFERLFFKVVQVEKYRGKHRQKTWEILHNN